jgi:hypothetical protein
MVLHGVASTMVVFSGLISPRAQERQHRARGATRDAQLSYRGPTHARAHTRHVSLRPLVLSLVVPPLPQPLSLPTPPLRYVLRWVGGRDWPIVLPQMSHRAQEHNPGQRTQMALDADGSTTNRLADPDDDARDDQRRATRSEQDKVRTSACILGGPKKHRMLGRSGVKT